MTDGSLNGMPAVGADGLRLWVALAGAETSGESKIGRKVIEDIDNKVGFDSFLNDHHDMRIERRLQFAYPFYFYLLP